MDGQIHVDDPTSFAVVLRKLVQLDDEIVLGAQVDPSDDGAGYIRGVLI
jgi:hypothetical protein